MLKYVTTIQDIKPQVKDALKPFEKQLHHFYRRLFPSFFPECHQGTASKITPNSNTQKQNTSSVNIFFQHINILLTTI